MEFIYLYPKSEIRQRLSSNCSGSIFLFENGYTPQVQHTSITYQKCSSLQVVTFFNPTVEQNTLRNTETSQGSTFCRSSRSCWEEGLLSSYRGSPSFFFLGGGGKLTTVPNNGGVYHRYFWGWRYLKSTCGHCSGVDVCHLSTKAVRYMPSSKDVHVIFVRNG